MKVVLDASVIVAAVASKNPRSAARVILEARAAGGFDLVVTDEIEAEYREMVQREKVRRAAPRVRGLSLVEALVATAERVQAEPVRIVANDPDDDKYVAAALTAGAAYVVSFDRRHLVAISEHQGVRFVTPGEFLGVLRAATPS